jgi:hypothetical protein
MNDQSLQARLAVYPDRSTADAGADQIAECLTGFEAHHRLRVDPATLFALVEGG